MKNFLTFLCVGILSIFHNNLECMPASAITAKNELIAAFNATHTLTLSTTDPLYAITVVRETPGKTELISDRDWSECNRCFLEPVFMN